MNRHSSHCTTVTHSDRRLCLLPIWLVLLAGCSIPLQRRVEMTADLSCAYTISDSPKIRRDPDYPALNPLTRRSYEQRLVDCLIREKQPEKAISTALEWTTGDGPARALLIKAGVAETKPTSYEVTDFYQEDMIPNGLLFLARINSGSDQILRMRAATVIGDYLGEKFVSRLVDHPAPAMRARLVTPRKTRSWEKKRIE